jgi:uncharacterized protein YprB with RNaseH-like and TPR domain
MSVEEVVMRMQDKRYLLEMGKNKLAKWFKCSSEDIKKAKKIVRGFEIKDIKKPRLLFLDIETAPLRSYTWRLWKQDIPTAAIISDWWMIAWSAKWAGEEGVFSQVVTSKEALLEDDSRIVSTLWSLLNQANIVCTHNGERFDIPRIRSRFLVHGLPPTKPYLQIDTLKVVKKEFGFSSNKLDYIAQVLGLPGKLPTSLDLWIKCMEGDIISLKTMEEYNRNDVIVLEQVYMKLRPFVKTHPNFNLWSETNDPVCPHCGSKNLIPETGGYYTQTAQYNLHKCLDCGAISRERKTVISKEKSILVSIPGR